MRLFLDLSCLLVFCRVCPENFPAKGLKLLPIVLRIVQHSGQRNSKDRRYFTGDRVQRKLKWAFGTWSPFTEHSIAGLLYTVAVYGQSESLHRYPVIVYLSSATVWVHGSRLSTKFIEVSRDIFFFILGSIFFHSQFVEVSRDNFF